MTGTSTERYKELYKTSRKRALTAPSESEEQQALFQWARLHECAYPGLELLHHIPNGGKRDIKTAKRLKAEGVKAGKNKTTESQNEWLEKLTQQGYYAAVCYGWEAASEVIMGYLKL